MNGWTLTRVWDIDGILVVAPTAGKAIELMKIYRKDNYYEPHSIKGISTGSLSQDYDVIIKGD